MKKPRQIILYISLLVLLVFVILPTALSFGKYNSAILFVVPFGIGLVFTLLLSLFRKPHVGKLLLYSLILMLVVCLSTFFFAGEGMICFLIMGLFILIPYYLGVIIGYFIQKEILVKNTLLLIVFASIISSATIENTYNQSTIISDELIIEMPAGKLWEKLNSPVNFGESSDFFFKNGVSYPNYMHIETINGKLYLLCEYNNGKVAAPIIEYCDQKYFSFTFNDSIATMKEKNFYNESRTMHIKNHFSIDYGKFEIIQIDNNRCKLIATTSFRHKFEPEFYTNFWVSYFVHNIHKHVLTSINKNS